MHLKIQLGAALASELPSPAQGQWSVDRIQDMKLRSFIPPGAVLRLDATLKDCAKDAATVALEARAGQELIATAALALKVGDVK
jgi:3-hydroxymyristoyl/3-hydroxydecanoyl-(acyl carrier protein) dehydratase